MFCQKMTQSVLKVHQGEKAKQKKKPFFLCEKCEILLFGDEFCCIQLNQCLQTSGFGLVLWRFEVIVGLEKEGEQKCFRGKMMETGLCLQRGLILCKMAFAEASF